MEDPKIRMMKINEEFVRDVAQKAIETDEEPTKTARHQGRLKVGLFVAKELEIVLDDAFSLVSFILRMYAKTTPEEEMVIRTRNLFLSLA